MLLLLQCGYLGEFCDQSCGTRQPELLVDDGKELHSHLTETLLVKHQPLRCEFFEDTVNRIYRLLHLQGCERCTQRDEKKTPSKAGEGQEGKNSQN